ncbi:uncharacterized protein B0I36DRAFT_353399 [Microdochium trichocladiopsis]|uniref:JmjC domain-containing protein n=1 Tax=Microdochium trichocladiopsis TaxID=1682393 RepID=A0A9P8Y061_9PEZI|nr:uncharacterized protein B0I36DRAFT_353399 [Microdochium trichocladiopsis]KAH7025260.1 hypothetical protein B0I36DRAFT_353399 [Microdochium trichocladiopsis]
MAILVHRASELTGQITQFISALDATTHAELISHLTGACDALTRLTTATSNEAATTSNEAATTSNEAATTRNEATTATNNEAATTNDERPAQNSGKKRKRLSDASYSTHDASPEVARYEPQPEAGYEVHRSRHSFTIQKEEMGENLVGKLTTFEAPNFADRVIAPSDDNVRAYLDEIFTSIPEEEVPYYVGLLLFDSRIDDILFPGNRNSGTVFHCEDGVMRSVNLTLFGWNIWILVAVHHIDKLESFLLGKVAEIDFIVLLAGPGDLVETQPRQYHWVINYSTVVKMAINFLRPGECALPESVRLCDECGLAPLQPHFDQITLVQTKRSSARLRKPGTKAASPGEAGTKTMPPSKRTPRTSSASRPLKDRTLGSPAKKPQNSTLQNAANSAAQRVYPHKSDSQDICAAYLSDKVTLYTPITDTFEESEALHLMLVLNSNVAVHSLIAVVYGWRARSSTMINHHADLTQTIQAIINVESNVCYKEAIHALLLIQFADKVDKLADGRLRLTNADWKKVQESSPTAKQMSNKKLRRWRESGRKLKLWPPSILCAIAGHGAAPFSLSLYSLTGLTDKSRQRVLAALINSSEEGITSRILEVGAYIADSFLKGLDLDEFAWESLDALCLDQPSEREVLKWLRRFRVVEECCYEPERFHR